MVVDKYMYNLSLNGNANVSASNIWEHDDINKAFTRGSKEISLIFRDAIERKRRKGKHILAENLLSVPNSEGENTLKNDKRYPIRISSKHEMPTWITSI